MLGSKHRAMKEMCVQPSRSLQEKQSSLFTFRFKRQFFSTFDVPGDVTGTITLPSHRNPKGRYYDHFYFTDEETEAQRVKIICPGSSSRGCTGIWIQVYAAPNTDGLTSITDVAHLSSSLQWRFLKMFREPWFHFVSMTTLGRRHQCPYFTNEHNRIQCYPLQNSIFLSLTA